MLHMKYNILYFLLHNFCSILLLYYYLRPFLWSFSPKLIYIWFCQRVCQNLVLSRKCCFVFTSYCWQNWHVCILWVARFVCVQQSEWHSDVSFSVSDFLFYLWLKLIWRLLSQSIVYGIFPTFLQFLSPVLKFSRLYYETA